jgi:hypothetical protein
MAELTGGGGGFMVTLQKFQRRFMTAVEAKAAVNMV